jgi:hypothetical protein
MEHTYSIPDIAANPLSYTVPVPVEDPVIFDDFDTERRQLYEQIARAETVRKQENVVTPAEVEPIPYMSKSSRETFLMGLYEKHKGLPSAYHSTTKRQHHHNPNPEGVTRIHLHPEGPVWGNNFNDLEPGDVFGNKVRKHFNNPAPRIFDGRIDSQNNIVDTNANGAVLMAKQSPYEAIRSQKRSRAEIGRETRALKNIRNNNATQGRVMAMSWQGPTAITRIGSNDRIPKRQTKQEGYHAFADGSVYQRAYQKPDETFLRPVMNRVTPGRIEITGSVAKSERPNIENFVDPKQRPRYSNLRHGNSTDISTYAIDPVLGPNRKDNFITTVRPTFIAGPQKTNWAVGSNRAPRQTETQTSYDEWNTSLSTGEYEAAYAARHNGSELYERPMGFNGILNKIAPFPENERLLTHRDPLLPDARHIDRYKLE